MCRFGIRASFPTGTLKFSSLDEPTRTLQLVGILFGPGVGYTPKFHNVFPWLPPG